MLVEIVAFQVRSREPLKITLALGPQYSGTGTDCTRVDSRRFVAITGSPRRSFGAAGEEQLGEVRPVEQSISSSLPRSGLSPASNRCAN